MTRKEQAEKILCLAKEIWPDNPPSCLLGIAIEGLLERGFSYSEIHKLVDMAEKFSTIFKEAEEKSA